MELFEEIRREHAHGAGTIRAVAKELGVHRRMVRQALASAIPGKSPPMAPPPTARPGAIGVGRVCSNLEKHFFCSVKASSAIVLPRGRVLRAYIDFDSAFDPSHRRSRPKARDVGS